VEGRLPLLGGAEGLGEGGRQTGAARGYPLGGRAETREVVLVQNHSVVLEAQATGQLGELRVLARRLTGADHRRKLLVEHIDLLDVARVRGEVFLDLGVRDPVETTELKSALRIGVQDDSLGAVRVQRSSSYT
jgi:hypothetical protein